MYARQASEIDQEAAQAALHLQLKRDASGELRDQLVDELIEASHAIQAALAARPVAAQAEVLRNLLEAVRLSELVLLDVWNSFHA